MKRKSGSVFSYLHEKIKKKDTTTIRLRVRVLAIEDALVLPFYDIREI